MFYSAKCVLHDVVMLTSLSPPGHVLLDVFLRCCAYSNLIPWCDSVGSLRGLGPAVGWAKEALPQGTRFQVRGICYHVSI